MTAIYEAATAVLGVTTAAGAIATAFLVRSRAAVSARADTREKELGDEFRHLVTTRLPGYALHLVSSHHPVPGPLHEHLAETEYGKLCEAALDQFSNTILKERHRIDKAAWAAVRGSAQEIQTLSYRVQTVVEDMQEKYHEPPELLEDLLQLDHLNEQELRVVQKQAIASGAWPGHVREDTQLPNVVSGAKSRLHGLERIRITSQLRSTNLGVVGRAAEPLAVVCTELMANALEHSRDDLVVEVTLMQSDNGSACVIVDDAGTGWTSEALERGMRLVAGEGLDDLLLADLGDPPAQGFIAIGRLVADYGFEVTINLRSPYGGVRTVVEVPSNLLTEVNEKVEPLSAMAPLPAPAPRTARRPAAEQRPSSPAEDGSGLPQRRRRVRAQVPQAAPPAAPRLPDPDEAGEAYRLLQEGMAAGHAGADSEETTTNPEETT